MWGAEGDEGEAEGMRNLLATLRLNSSKSFEISEGRTPGHDCGLSIIPYTDSIVVVMGTSLIKYVW